MASEDTYLVLRDCLCGMVYPEDLFLKIKHEFRNDIDSNRLFDKITTMPYLIKILERRDTLHAGNIHQFQIIGKFFNDKKINSLIETCKSFESLKCPGDTQRPVQVNTRDFMHPHTQNQVIPAVIEDPNERAYDLICNDIGKKWKDFARALHIREGYIDALEEKYPSIYNRVQEVLNHHNQTNGTVYEVFNALDKARRKDLKLEVQKILEKVSTLN